MTEIAPVVTRFAPSPTGYLHLGHLVNAIYVWGLARTVDGQVILRMEDHDQGRCRPEYETAILDDLDWLGLIPDRGEPVAFRQGPSPFRQSDCTERYEQRLDALAAQGLLYTCTCSRKDILARTGRDGEELHYDGHCRNNGYDPNRQGGTRVRLDPMEIHVQDGCLGAVTQCPAAQCGDLLLQDRHGNWTYQFAVVVDDWAQAVNLVIRGEDLLASTGRQVQLAKLLGREDAPCFLHHPLIADPDGKKLSKRDFAKGLRDYRAEGRTPESMLGEAAWCVGLVPSREDLAVEALPKLFANSAPVHAIRTAFSYSTSAQGE